MAHKPAPAKADISNWLSQHCDSPVLDLEPISGGFWSSAWGFRAGDEAYVLRLSDLADGFAIDRAAMAFASADLPVPRVVDTGTALGLRYAISVRHYGRFVETAPVSEANDIGMALGHLLTALRAAPTDPDSGPTWHEPDVVGGTWRDWLRAGLVDDPAAHVNGWRATLARKPELDSLFRVCTDRIETLLPFCPERRDLVHGDLLHQNVLVSDRSTDEDIRVTAIFSWKCSILGDFLYDVAWCTFWGGWHPVIKQADLWQRTLTAPELGSHDLHDAALRHHCYELQIAASHLGWNAWTGDDAGLEAVATAATELLRRGPLG